MSGDDDAPGAGGPVGGRGATEPAPEAPPMPDWLRGAVDQVRATPVPDETAPAMDFRP